MANWWERAENWDDGMTNGPSDDHYEVDPDEEDMEIEARLTAYENWLGRT